MKKKKRINIDPVNLHPDLSGRPKIFLGPGTKKKSSMKYWPEKNRLQIAMTLFFSTCFFQVHILDLIFFKVTNWPKFSEQESWVQIDWATESRSFGFHSSSTAF